MKVGGRDHERLATRAVLLATSLGVAFTSPAPAAQTPTAAAAVFEECRALVARDDSEQAIARCQEAVRLDPQRPDLYLMLGAAHDALWQRDRVSATGDASRMLEHRRKAMENYERFLTLNRGDTEARRRARPPALSALLGIYISGDEANAAAREYADELAREPSLGRRERLILAAAYSRLDRPELSEQFLVRHWRPTRPTPWFARV